jgi:hypothetical protein
MLVLELSLATKFGLQTKPVPPISISGSLSYRRTMHIWHVDKLNLQDGAQPSDSMDLTSKSSEQLITCLVVHAQDI